MMWILTGVLLGGMVVLAGVMLALATAWGEVCMGLLVVAFLGWVIGVEARTLIESRRL